MGYVGVLDRRTEEGPEEEEEEGGEGEGWWGMDWSLVRLQVFSAMTPTQTPTQIPSQAATESTCKLTTKLTCRECSEWLMDYVEGALSPEKVESFESHVAGCPACDVYVKNYRRVVEMASLLGRPAAAPKATPVPSQLVSSILRAVGDTAE